MARHANDQVTVHPTALMMGADLGLTTKDMREIIAHHAEGNPAALIGGYLIDVPIIALAATLRLEDDRDTGRTPASAWQANVVIQNMIEHYMLNTGGI